MDALDQNLRTLDAARRVAEACGQDTTGWRTYSVAELARAIVETKLPEPVRPITGGLLPTCRCWNEGQWGRVHREDCPIHGPKAGPLTRACPTCQAEPGEACGGHPPMDPDHVHMSRMVDTTRWSR